MRIISPFHDYYDVVQSQGQDHTLIYQRRERTITPKTYPFPVFHRWWRHYPGDMSLYQKVIGFCGKIYPAFWLSKGEVKKTAFNIGDVDKFVHDNFNEKQIEGYMQKRHKRWKSGTNKNWPFEQARFKFIEFFDKLDKEKDKYRELFEQERCPIFVAESRETDRITWKAVGTITFNPRLKDYDFQRAFDPYQAFQEISMFMGNLAEPRKPIPPISDEIMAEIKGFDKWSFRKPPSKSA